MRHTLLCFEHFRAASLRGSIAVAIVSAGLLAIPAWAQQHGQKTFASADEACRALFSATRSNDESALLEMFGPEGKLLIASGDEVEDAASRATFVQRYLEMHRLVQEPDGSTTLYIGPHNWPTPIPLREKGQAWYFDTAAGKQEILFRRIGQNETSTIRVCQELVAAQKEYFAAKGHEYAQALSSSGGRHNGLYWPAAEGEPKSPIGPLVAVARTGAPGQESGPPYRGYHFRILTRQGSKATGGALSYVVGGRMTRGFAFVAIPARYRSSGVMTFMVNQDGVVRQKDLGPKTVEIATKMNQYNPDFSWKTAHIEETP